LKFQVGPKTFEFDLKMQHCTQSLLH